MSHPTKLELVSQHENDNEREPYRAFELGKGNRPQKRLMLIDADGSIIGMPAYHQLIDALCTHSQFVWLVYGNTAFQITGRNLPDDLLTLMQDDRVRSLQCYSKARFLEPELDVVVIDSITRHSVKDFMLQQEDR